jgi:hypothetical protein
MYPEMSGLGSLLAKDKNIKIIFIQNNLLVIAPDQFYRISKTLFKYQTKDSHVKAFFEPSLSQLILF